MAQTGCKSISDYGAGKQRLFAALKEMGKEPTNYFAYDPVFPDYGVPQPADLVYCIDVLVHIEPDHIDEVLVELSRITTNLGFFSIHMGPAEKQLSDGRNAHLIQKPTSWWLKKLTDHFEILHLQSHQIMGDGVWLIVAPQKSHN